MRFTGKGSGFRLELRGLCFKNHAMGLSDNGNDPVTLIQTRCSCARGQGADQDIVTCVVPGCAGFAAQFNLVGVCPTRKVLCAPLRAPTAPVPSVVVSPSGPQG
jgi:hypothetical protein